MAGCRAARLPTLLGIIGGKTVQVESASRPRRLGWIIKPGSKSRAGPELMFILVVISDVIFWDLPRVDASILESLSSRFVVVRSKYRSAVPRAVAHPGPTGADTLHSIGEEKQKRSKNLLALGYILRQHVLDPPGFPLQCDPSSTLLGSLCADGWVLDKLPGCICSAGIRPGMNMSRRTTVWWNYH